MQVLLSFGLLLCDVMKLRLEELSTEVVEQIWKERLLEMVSCRLPRGIKEGRSSPDPEWAHNATWSSTIRPSSTPRRKPQARSQWREASGGEAAMGRQRWGGSDSPGERSEK